MKDRKELELAKAYGALSGVKLEQFTKYHWRVYNGLGECIDFWPSTGRWKAAKLGGHTLHGLVAYLKETKGKAGCPAYNKQVVFDEDSPEFLDLVFGCPKERALDLSKKHLIKYKDAEGEEEPCFDAEASYTSLLHHLCAQGVLTEGGFANYNN